MYVYKKLPQSHKGNQIASIALEQSRVLSRLIRIASALLAAAVFGLGFLLFPASALTQMQDPFWKLVAMMLGMMAVSLVHELLRGFLMRIFSGVKPILRYVGSYPQAACEAYFARPVQQVLNLVPPAAVIALAACFVLLAGSDSWRWVAWLVFTVAVCSQVGDVYVAWRLTQLPSDILVMNVGPTYLIYSAGKKEDEM